MLGFFVGKCRAGSDLASSQHSHGSHKMNPAVGYNTPNVARFSSPPGLLVLGVLREGHVGSQLNDKRLSNAITRSNAVQTLHEDLLKSVVFGHAIQGSRPLYTKSLVPFDQGAAVRNVACHRLFREHMLARINGHPRKLWQRRDRGRYRNGVYILACEHLLDHAILAKLHLRGPSVKVRQPLRGLLSPTPTNHYVHLAALH
mmetsp:Transcript_24198/g.59037  ORF Transcript_24198/g.59037 Transcript_24198/m.59037 type:complete len:201 (+) Transcript_24198:193-795(+)